MATNRAEGHRGRDVAPKILGDFTKALAHLASEGKPLEELFKEAIREQGILKVLEVISRYNPKSVDATIQQVSIEDFVTNRVAAQTNDSTEETQLH